jgi:nucleotide-binding universal stress UspA family protein
MYSHILVALDGSEVAEQVLPHVEALAEKFGSRVTLLRAIMPPALPLMETPMGLPVTPYTSEVYVEAAEAERQAASDYLREVGDRLRERGFQVEHELPDGPPASVIVERAGALGTDLIAMTTHGRGGLERLLLGSVAEEALRKAPCPVLLVRAKAETRQREQAREEQTARNQ